MRDPIETEIIGNAFATIAEEMSVTVIRGGFSSWIKGSADASAAIFDEKGQLIAQSAGTAVLQMSSLRASLPEVLKDYPAERMYDGDVYVMNDPYRGGIHSNDLEVFQPVHVNGQVAYFTGTLIHVADLGGVSAGGLPAQATDVFHEGLLVPPVPLYVRGVPNDTVTKIIGLNSRVPEKVLGDLRALVAGCMVGARRLSELVQRYGHSVLEEVVEDLFDYTEQRMRREISELPGGSFTGAFTIDDDGIDLDKSYVIRVAIERHGSGLVMDFTGTDFQASGPINAAYSQALTAAIFGARCYLDRTIPTNEGVFRPMQVILPHGTLVNPRWPAACNARAVTVTAMIEAVIVALSRQQPGRAVAASGINHLVTMSGSYPDGQGIWLVKDSNVGGVGARMGMDGVDVGGALVIGGRGVVLQVEDIEADSPLIYERHALWADSGGPGQWRGGLGVERTIRFLCDGEFSARTDRLRFPPPGSGGGRPGRSGGWIINRGRADEVLLPSKQMGVHVKTGDTLTMLTTGGGGFGPPWERDPDVVRSDVLSGRVSMGGAEEDYDVVFMAGTDRVDGPGTAVRRLARARAEGGS